jgi:acetone carboxylase gamma subunit|tara:strand:+ start:329 stop:556 length:228 start_codon:yes stop_codon:yes gene_type:complete
MKITVNPEVTTKETPYPKLMISTVSGSIFLMVNPSEGTILKASSGTSVGDYVKNWAFNNFKDYKGTITLENTHEA